MTSNQAASPFAELDARDVDSYDLTVWLSANVCSYPNGFIPDMHATTRDFCIEASRKDGAWSLCVSPWNGSLEGDDVLTGPSLLELRGQTTGTDPLTLLRALLSGQSA
jgi:hypothetical protein